MRIDLKTGKPVLANITGGLSGPAVKPVGIRCVYQCARQVNIPIIGVGGIANSEDVLEYLLAGASAVEVGAMNFKDPYICKKIIEDLPETLNKYGYTSVHDVIERRQNEQNNYCIGFFKQGTGIRILRQFDEPVYVKIGMELTYACGLDIVKEVKNMGHKIFLDLKLHDIPNTVKGGMKNLAKLGVDIVNCHCAGGIEMMKAAKQGILEGTPEGQQPAKLIGVTVLTSTSKESMNEELGIPGEVIDTVIHYAKNAKEAGLDGVVCSVHEAKAIHEACGDDFLTVTPGIRLAGNSVDDQKRVATPEFAKEQGCDMIVVGRSITKSEDPKATYKAIEEVME